MILELKDISKRYRDTVALDSVSCTINDGEFVSFLGPSGSGKSTLLSIISGIIEPSYGQVLFDGKNVKELLPKERSIGFVFQNYALYPNMTVAKNIEFPLEALKIKSKERQERVLEIARTVKIEHLLNKKPHELSGGEQQRVAIARALVKKPALLMLDEPFSNLDPRLSSETRDEIKALQTRLKITTILVTHNQAEAMELSDKIAILSQGRLMQYGVSKDLYNNPANIFCAEFLGDTRINTISGTVKNGLFTSDDGAIAIDSLELSDGATLMCIRPESVVLGDGDISLRAKAISSYNHGREYIISAIYGSNEIKLFVDANSSYIPSVNDTITLGLNRSKLLFFCKNSGERK